MGAHTHELAGICLYPTPPPHPNKKWQESENRWPFFCGEVEEETRPGPGLSASIHTKPQIWDLRKHRTVSSGVRTVLILVGRFVWSVSTLGVQSVVSEHVTSALARVLSGDTPRVYFIGFEPTKYSLWVLHKISFFQHPTKPDCIVKLTRRLETRGPCGCWILLIHSSQRACTWQLEGFLTIKVQGLSTVSAAPWLQSVYFQFPWAALSNQGLRSYAVLLGELKFPALVIATLLWRRFKKHLDTV